MNIKKQAFTLVELLVSIMIISILASIGFYSYVGYLPEARNAERKANIGETKSAFKLYKQKRGAYPIPGDSFNITNNSYIVATQGFLNENVPLTTMDSIPLDPQTNTYYFYSIFRNKQEFQIAISMEKGDEHFSLLEGDYKTVSKNVLPSIILAISSSTDIEIHEGTGDGTNNRNLFIMDGGKNLPYIFEKPYDPYYAGETIDNVLISGNINFWQNSDYRSCNEINEVGKFIHETGTEEYQILDNNGILVNTGCTL